MAFFNSSSVWNVNDFFDTDFFEPFDTRLQPELHNGQLDFEHPSKAITKTDRQQSKTNNRSSLFRSLVNDSIFKRDIDITVPIDLIEKEDKYVLHASIPGVPKDQINLDFDSDNKELAISGTVPEVSIEKNENDKHYKELRSGSFERKVRFGVGADVDSDKISATYVNGILTVIVPKIVLQKEKKKVRTITIESHE